MSKNNTGLVDYAKVQLGKPYWYGTFGQTATAALYKDKRTQYPQYYASWSDFPMQYGERVHDCIGLIKGYLWSDSTTSTPRYNGMQDVGANGMRALCSASNDMASIPDIPGILVFMSGHVGIYIGGGKVIEAAGHQYGVVMTDLKSRKLGGCKAKAWQYWGKCPWISYDDVKTVTIKAGTWNVRKGVGTSYGIVKTVKGGSVYTSSKESNGWYYLDTVGGWISGKGIC